MFILLLCLLPAYWSANHMFECPGLLLQLQLSTMTNSRVIEWWVAFMACCFAGGSSFTAYFLYAMVHSDDWLATLPTVPRPRLAVTTMSSTNKTVVTWKRLILLFIIWIIVALILSGPSFLYIVAQSIPGDNNSLHLTSNTLEVFHHVGGLLVSFISLVPVPVHSRRSSWEGTQIMSISIHQGLLSQHA